MGLIHPQILQRAQIQNKNLHHLWIGAFILRIGIISKRRGNVPRSTRRVKVSSKNLIVPLKPSGRCRSPLSWRNALGDELQPSIQGHAQRLVLSQDGS